jgi:hypothetical protein
MNPLLIQYDRAAREVERAYIAKTEAKIAYAIASEPERRSRDVFEEIFKKAQIDAYRTDLEYEAAMARFKAVKKELYPPDSIRSIIAFYLEHIADGINCFVGRQIARI